MPPKKSSTSIKPKPKPSTSIKPTTEAHKSSPIQSLSSNYDSSPSPKPNEEQENALIEKAEKRLEKMKAKGKQIKNKDCANLQDPISYMRIPKKYAIYIDKQCYDARMLKEAIEKNKVIPLSNRKQISSTELNTISMKAMGIGKGTGMKIPPMILLEDSTDIRYNLYWSLDNTKIAGGTWDYIIKIWNAKTGKILKKLKAHDLTINIIAWSPDGTKIASGSTDGTLRIWYYNTGAYTTFDYDISITDILWSPDGKKVILGSNDGNIRIVDVTTTETLKTLNGHRGWIEKLVWKQYGSIFLSNGSDDTINVWNYQTGENISKFKLDDIKIRLDDNLNPDGTKILSEVRDNSIKIWNVLTGEVIKILKSENYAYTFAWSPDGTRFVSSNHAGYITIWDEEGNKIKTFKAHLPDTNPGKIYHYTINKLRWSPDGTKIISVSDDKYIRIWNAQTGINLMTIPDYIAMMDWSPNKKMLPIRHYNDTIKILDLSNLNKT